MKLNSLSSLRGLEDVKSVPNIKPLVFSRVWIDKSFMNSIEIISYSTNLCLFFRRLLDNEIIVPNREKTLRLLETEITELYMLISKDDYCLINERTHGDTKKFYKSVGLKPKHIETN